MDGNKRPKKIGIMGCPISSGNRGVLALGSSIASLCLSHSGADEVVFFLGNADNRPFPIRHKGQTIPVRVVNYRMSPRSRPSQHLFWIMAAAILYRLIPIRSVRNWLMSVTPWVKEVAESEFVGDVRGGDSFSDIYGMKRFLISFLPAWSIILIKGRLVQYPQTYGPYKSPIARRIAAFLIRRSAPVVARDTKSQAVAESLKAPSQTIELSPDVAFSLEPIVPKTFETVPANAGAPDSSCIGINVNGLMYNGGYNRSNMFGLKLDYPTFLEGLLLRLLKEQEGDIWLISHTFAPKGDVESDNDASLLLRDRLPAELRPRIKVLASELDQYEVKGLIGRCGFFIGSRMHSCIAALSQSVPCIGLAYSMKFYGVFESVGAQECVIDARDHDNESAIDECVRLFHQRDAIRPILQEMVAVAKPRLATVFAKMGGIETPPNARAAMAAELQPKSSV